MQCRNIGNRLDAGRAIRNEVVYRYRYQAHARGLTWGLSDDEADALFAGVCYWCGEPPSNIGHGLRNHGSFIYSGIDRVNNALGYEPGNAVSCCIVCNSMKRELPVEVFIDRVLRIAERRAWS